MFIALTPDASVVGLACLLAQRLLADTAPTAFDIVAVSIRQAMVDGRALGRVGAGFHVLAMGAMIVGTAAGGIVDEMAGVRTALALGAAPGVIALAVLWFSALGRMGDVPGRLAPPAQPVIAGEDVPLAE